MNISDAYVRSGQPLNLVNFSSTKQSWVFARDEILDAFRFRALMAGVPFPSDFEVYDFSFLYAWVPSQNAKIIAEEAFFKVYMHIAAYPHREYYCQPLLQRKLFPALSIHTRDFS